MLNIEYKYILNLFIGKKEKNQHLNVLHTHQRPSQGTFFPPCLPCALLRLSLPCPEKSYFKKMLPCPALRAGQG
jgi:hypothetical protein